MKTRTLQILAVSNIFLVILAGSIFYAHRAPDFLAFYSAGKIAASQPSAVYQRDKQEAEYFRYYPDYHMLYYFHPPLELPLFAALAALPFGYSFLLWNTLNAGLAIASARLLRLPWWTAFAFFGTIGTLCLGQDDILLLFLICLSLYFLRRDQEIYAGIALALACFKPQIPLIILLALIPRRKFVAAFAATGASTFGLLTFWFGPSWISQLHELIRYQEPREHISGMVSLHALTLGTPWLTVVLSAGILGMFVLCWRENNIDFRVGSAVLIGLLVGYHIHPSELTLLVIPYAYLFRRELSPILETSMLALMSSASLVFFTVLRAEFMLAPAIIVLALEAVGTQLRTSLGKERIERFAASAARTENLN